MIFNLTHIQYCNSWNANFFPFQASIGIQIFYNV